MQDDFVRVGGAAEVMRSVIARIATGPELSKDIPREEARQAMRLVLDGAVDPVQAGIFLIALRMKRETDEENEGILQALLETTHQAVAPVDDVVDIADPYDGFNRTVPASPFLPALLAACGVPAVSHGVQSMGPKYGVTHRQVLAAAAVPVDLGPDACAARVGDARIGWAYIDQKTFNPKLYALAGLRALIVKRPALTTAESLLGPIRGRLRTHLVTGYVHKAYPRVYALLARHAGFQSALIVRGVEGGVIASLRAAGKAFRFWERGPEEAVDFSPADLGVDQAILAPAVPGRDAGDGKDEDARAVGNAEVTRLAVEAGLAALAGRPGPTRDSLICGAALCLWHLRRADSLHDAAARVRRVLDSGAALERIITMRLDNS